MWVLRFVLAFGGRRVGFKVFGSTGVWVLSEFMVRGPPNVGTRAGLTKNELR